MPLKAWEKQYRQETVTQGTLPKPDAVCSSARRQAGQRQSSHRQHRERLWPAGQRHILPTWSQSPALSHLGNMTGTGPTYYMFLAEYYVSPAKYSSSLRPEPFFKILTFKFHLSIKYWSGIYWYAQNDGRYKKTQSKISLTVYLGKLTGSPFFLPGSLYQLVLPLQPPKSPAPPIMDRSLQFILPWKKTLDSKNQTVLDMRDAPIRPLLSWTATSLGPQGALPESLPQTAFPLLLCGPFLLLRCKHQWARACASVTGLQSQRECDMHQTASPSCPPIKLLTTFFVCLPSRFQAFLYKTPPSLHNLPGQRTVRAPTPFWDFPDPLRNTAAHTTLPTGRHPRWQASMRLYCQHCNPQLLFWDGHFCHLFKFMYCS